MRLIDADKLQKAIPAEEDNITGMGMTYDEMEAYNDGIDEQWKKIVNAPTIEPEQHWIPCSERLPEKYGNYLVTTDDGEVDIGSCDPENKDRQDHFWGGCDADGFFWYGENIVIAWMKLPEPYQGEGEQE